MRELIRIYMRDIEADGFKAADILTKGLPMVIGLLAACALAELLSAIDI